MMIARLKAYRKNPSVQYTLMSIAASGINFLTLIIWGRVFSVEDYGSITTLQAFLSNIAVFVTPLQIMLCKAMAMHTTEKDKIVTDLLHIMFMIYLAELFFMIATARMLINYLHFAGGIEIFLFGSLVFLNNSYIVLNGIVQGKQDFILLGRTNLVLYVLKMLLSTSSGLHFSGPLAVMFGFAAAECLCIILIIRKYKDIFRQLFSSHKFRIDLSVLKNYFWMFVLYMIVSLYMNNGDLLLGNLYCSQEEIGFYSVAISLSKISIFFIATPVATILLPKIAAVQNNEKYRKKMLFVSETVTLIISVSYGICYCLLGQWGICLLYGESYRNAAKYLLPCMLFSIVLGIFWVFYQYVMAIDLIKIFTIATAAIGLSMIAFILFSKAGLSLIPVIMAAAMLVTMVTIILYQLLKEKLNGTISP